MIIPGTRVELTETRAATGQLLALSAGGRRYLDQRGDWRHYDNGVATSEAAWSGVLLRHVRGPYGSWVEEYRCDRQGRPTLVDGVPVERDGRGRVVRCGDWRYGYDGDRLTHILAPDGLRRLRYAGDRPGRVVARHGGPSAHRYGFDDDGRRLDATPLPPTWHRDELGRLWTQTDDDGTVLTTYLWDGFACLGRIDGPPGEPLAAVFSLDPTCTPVRVVGAAGVERIPRDAYGESLVDRPGVPGLYGAAGYGGLHHFAARALDPRCGSFCAPDPWHGGPADPRRAAGYRGPLPVEHGPYAVAQHDPVGRIDHTGEASGPLVVSSLTWSWQNNVLGWLGMDWVLNFWGSLFASAGDSEKWDHFTSSSGLSASDHVGAFAVRRDGIWSKRGATVDDDRAWTFQHMTWATERSFETLRAVQVFEPGAAYQPTLYGSVLQVRPTDGGSFVVRGNDAPARAPLPPLTWTRTAGADETGRSQGRPLYDGCRTSSFPASALHFASAVPGVNDLQDAAVAELVLSGDFGLGTLEPRSVLEFAGTGLGVSVGDLLHLSAASPLISRVLSVEETGGVTAIGVEDDVTGLTIPGARARAVNRADEEDLGRAGTKLDTVGSSSAVAGAPIGYTVGDWLQFDENGTLVVRQITGFEAQLSIDSGLPATLTAPLTLRLMTSNPLAGSGALTADPAVLRITAGARPAAGTAIVVTVGADAVPVFVLAQTGTDQVTLDRPLYTGPSQNGTAAPWKGLSAGVELASGTVVPTGTDLTYVPTAPRLAPSTGFVAIEAAGGRTLRRVTALAYDALVLDGTAAGLGPTVHVVHYVPTAGGLDQPIAAARQDATLALQPGEQLFAAAADPSRLVAHLMPLAGPALVTPTTTLAIPAGATATFTANGLTVPYAAGDARDVNLGLGEPVVLDPVGGSFELNVVSELWLTVEVDRAQDPAATGLRICPLMAGSFGYDATRLNNSAVTVLPTVGGTTRVQLPQFAVGEIVRVAFTAVRPPAATPPVPEAMTHYYTVTAVEGCTLTLAADPAVYDLNLPADATGIVVTRMVPNEARTGTPWQGIDGTVPTPTQLRLRVWRASAADRNAVFAVVNGTVARPAVSTGAASLEIVFARPPVAASYTVGFPDLGLTAASVYTSSITRTGDAYRLTDVPAELAAVASGTLIVATSYVEGPPVTAGRLGPGTVRVPDHESVEVDRRQSLVDHELTHTLQSARWGPLMLCFLPVQLFMIDQGIAALTGLDKPQFSPYVACTARRDNTTYSITIPDMAGVDFKKGSLVELSRLGVVFMAELGEPAGGRFPLVAESFDEITLALTETDAPAQVRLNRTVGFWGDLGRHSLYSLMRSATHGHVLNLIVGSTYGGLFTLLARLVYFISRVAGSTTDFPATLEGDDHLRLGSEAARDALNSETRLAIKGRVAGDSDGSEQSLVRSVAERTEAGMVLVLNAPLPVGWSTVRVSPYSTTNRESNWDWHTYYPASVPDAARPAQVEIDKLGSSLSLAFPDEVWLRNGDVTWPAKVMTATDQGTTITAELNKPAPSGAADGEFRLAKVEGAGVLTGPGEAGSAVRDPLGFLFDDLLDVMGAGWMRWVFNPWGEAFNKLHAQVPTEGTSKYWRILTHIARTTMSTYGYSIAIPGWLIMDREIGDEWMSNIEQEASSASGDLYSPAGRLFGDFDHNDSGQPRFTVGDVARYIYYAHGRELMTLSRNRLDRPGVSFQPQPRLAPAGADPARALPDLWYAKDFANPYAVGDPAATEMNFAVADPGWVPATQRLERASMVYVAFSRPSGADRHRVTVTPTVNNFDRGQEANDDYQPLIFDCEVTDVDVTVAGQPVAADATVQLVHGQQARIAVGPTDGRRYAVALLRPVTGPVLQLGADLRLQAMAPGSEPAQVNRVHGVDELFTHAGSEVVVPVRELTVTVTATLPVFAALPPDLTGDLFAGLAASPHPGDQVFVVVPVSIQTPLAVDTATLAGLPVPTIGVEATPGPWLPFVGDGVIYSVTFAPDQPAADVPVRFTVTVNGAATTVLETTITLAPGP